MARMNLRDDAFDISIGEEQNTQTLCIPVSHWQEYTVDEALVSIGHGRAQRFLLMILGTCCATFSSNVVLMSYLEPNECLLPKWHGDSDCLHVL